MITMMMMMMMMIVLTHPDDDCVDSPVATLEMNAHFRFCERPKKTAAMAESEVQMMMIGRRPKMSLRKPQTLLPTNAPMKYAEAKSPLYHAWQKKGMEYTKKISVGSCVA